MDKMLNMEIVEKKGGLTEWIVNWKRNNWLTVSGTQVNNIGFWKKYEKLSQGRYIEFKYVKAQSQYFEKTKDHGREINLLGRCTPRRWRPDKLKKRNKT
ncbi:MAG: hypothetical protein GXO89_15525 [Chlorobi bacterium]|nr:hypothetical protein [Chlorobiota bacterium]